MSLPRDAAFDSTRAFLKEGYRFIGNRCHRFGSDIFEARLMGRRVHCMAGEAAARLFYGSGNFTRQGAMPLPVLTLLQDKGSVNQLDGEAHVARKAMFLGLLGPGGVNGLADAFEAEWRAAVGRWMGREELELHGEAALVLCRAVCAWAGVPLSEQEAEQRARELAAMIDAAGSPGLRNLRAHTLRWRTERWARRWIDRLRSARVDGTPAAAIAAYRDAAGNLLSRRTAAVELINLLRPAVAVARFITFAAHALHAHPEWIARLRDGTGREAEMFVQEVRRFYPFFPVVGGRAKQDFEWHGHHFSRGSWFLLDLYGTNRDPRLWIHAGSFRPERFLGWRSSGYDLIPQGAGDPARDHRCPGEAATVELMVRAVRMLAGSMTYDVPPQDLSIDLDRLPAIPRSRFVIRNVELA